MDSWLTRSGFLCNDNPTLLRIARDPEQRYLVMISLRKNTIGRDQSKARLCYHEVER